MKVIHLPTNVGSNPQGISRHLNEVGVKSETWVLHQDYLGYPADKVIIQQGENKLLAELKKFLSLRYVFLCDIVFFNFGGGLYRPIDKQISSFTLPLKPFAAIYQFYNTWMEKLELLLLRLRGIPIFIQYQGDDARQGDFSRKNFRITFANRVGSDYYTERSDAVKRKRIALFSRIAAKIYALNPDLLHVLPDRAAFLPYSHINLGDWEPHYTQMEARALRIGHAPSHRGVKGTDLVLEALKQLKNKGFDFDLVLVEGCSNSEAKEIYKTVDVLVDQLFAGWYGGLAVEAMALGKPVVAYIRDDDLKFIPAAMRDDIPIIRAEPDTLQNVLEQILLMSRDDLTNIARNSRKYVEKWHNPLEIAKRIKQDMEQALRAQK